MPLYECRSCSVLLTEKNPRCPVCKSHNAANGRGGSPLRRIDAEKLLGKLQ